MKFTLSFLILGVVAVGCGKKSIHSGSVSSGNIVNGNEVEYNTNDEVASATVYFKNKNGSTCSGVLISERAVLTAAHCLNASTPEIVHIGYIITNPNIQADNQFKVSKTILHESFDGKTLANDIALIILEKNVNLPYRPIRILDPSKKFEAGVPLTVLGFSPFTRSMRQDIFETFSYKILYNYTQDANKLRRQNVISNRNLEAEKKIEFVQVMGGICPGDSGGPSLVYLKGVPYLYGVNSFISSSQVQEEKYYDCEMVGASTVVASYRNWIESKLRGLPPPQIHKVQADINPNDQRCGNKILQSLGLFEERYSDNTCQNPEAVTRYLQGVVDECRNNCNESISLYVNCRYLEKGIRKFANKAKEACR